MMFKALPKRKLTVRRKTKMLVQREDTLYTLGRYMWCVACMSKRERGEMRYMYVICV